MPFWASDFSSTDTAITEPKRKFRFLVRFTGITGGSTGDSTALWYAKTAAKPSFTIAATEHKYLNHTFYYPGAVTWNEVAITLVDPLEPDVAGKLSQIVKAAGYVPPGTADDRSTMTKGKAAQALGQVSITQIDHTGTKELETWTLFNAWISDVKYGDLAYGDDELVELTVTLKYDWAKIQDSAGKTAFEGPLQAGTGKESKTAGKGE